MLTVAAAVIDTHALRWYLLGDLRISTVAKKFIDEVKSNEYIGISVITFIEIAYLVEKNKIASTSYEDIMAEVYKPDSIFKVIDLSYKISNVLRSIPRVEIPEMPDRIIAATGHHLNVPVIKRDLMIRASSVPTIW